ncbi:MAG: carbohydrate ABC transporter permease [Verrucomicrobiota bacterium]|nr:carbohydrate ABC transporter permease [Opitutales bacterium]
MRRRLLPLLIYGLLAVFATLTLTPFAFLVASTVKTKADFVSTLFLPAGDGLFGVGWDRLTGENYRRIFGELHVPRALLNSCFLASVGSLLATLFSAMGGYALAKFRFPGREGIIRLVLAALIIPGPLLIAPGFQNLWRLGLLDTYAGLMLPGLAPAFGVFLFRQTMLNAVPSELIEAARIDGAGEFRIFFTLVFPLVRPMFGAFLMIMFLGIWNDYLGPQIVLQSPELYPLSTTVAMLKNLHWNDYGLVMAGTLVAIAPVMCLFLLLQREFIAGLTSGAVKG